MEASIFTGELAAIKKASEEIEDLHDVYWTIYLDYRTLRSFSCCSFFGTVVDLGFVRVPTEVALPRVWMVESGSDAS